MAFAFCPRMLVAGSFVLVLKILPFLHFVRRINNNNRFWWSFRRGVTVHHNFRGFTYRMSLTALQARGQVNTQWKRGRRLINGPGNVPDSMNADSSRVGYVG